MTWELEAFAPATSRPNLRSVILFAIPKGGSTLLGNIARALAERIGMPMISIQEALFICGILHFGEKTRELGVPALFKPHGYIYGPFRQYPHDTIADLGLYTSVLLVRDPRDVLVSAYYSALHSHPAPGGQAAEAFLEGRRALQHLSIDAAVGEYLPTFLQYYQQFIDNLDLDRTHIFRYEDVIYDKQKWTAELAKIIDAPISATDAASIAGQHDIIPERERIAEHIRQVHPGNYKAKLKPETIESINRAFAPIMQRFGYDP